MNVKLHTPKSLKTGSGLSSTKQLLLSIIATTISIILTFGTAAVIDHNKKKAAKKVMVMTIIYDFNKTIEFMQEADSILREAKEMQMELATNPELFDSLCVDFPLFMPWVDEDFSETTETIFSTSIETFNTISDVNFINEVSSFYMARHEYKETVLDKMREDIQKHPYRKSLKEMMSISFPNYLCDNWVFLEDMKYSRDRCMEMMKVSEKDMIKFSKKIPREENDLDESGYDLKLIQECDSCNSVIQRVRKKL